MKFVILALPILLVVIASGCTIPTLPDSGFAPDDNTADNQNSFVCNESWTCTPWSPSVCPASGLKTRICTDENACGTSASKPSDSQTCVYSGSGQQSSGLCVESWSCGVWSECSGNVRARTCTDLNNCGTTNNKPKTTESCQEASPICGDNNCDYPVENLSSCWIDCKPEFDSGNFVASYSGQKLCSEARVKPSCCTGKTYYTQYDSYYTTEYVNSYETNPDFEKYYSDKRLILCVEKCNQFGYSGPAVVGYKYDAETGVLTSSETFMQCSCKYCE